MIDSHLISSVAPIVLVIGFLVTGVFVVIGIARESERERDKWQAIAVTLRCPKCGSAYDRWDGATWGVDAEPADSVLHNHGVVLRCPQCKADGFVVEDGNAIQVHLTIKEATGEITLT